MTTKYPDGSRVSEAFLNFDGGPSAKYVVPNHTPLAHLVIHGDPVPAGRPHFTPSQVEAEG